MGQINGIDIFGGNSLGVADAWNEVRIGGALGGDSPGEALRKGSIAILSNSGNFTTTMATYLRMAGWGTTTLISSGKDVYIHYAAPEFAFALANDARSKAAVLYVEPGGYYELDGQYTKPVVACVVGRWKTKLTRAVGHAGAMSGGADDAVAKERWFMEKFGVDGIFTPEKPIYSAKGALVTNIAHVPAALTAVMRENATRPDFAPEGSLALKPWFGSNLGIKLPPELDLATVEAMPPYDAQIAVLNKQIGAVIPRQTMKDCSGASVMDDKTQVTSVHGISVLDLAREPLEANFALPLVHEIADANDRALLDVAVAAEVNLVGDPVLVAADAAREAGNAPNSGHGCRGEHHRTEKGRARACLHRRPDRPLRPQRPHRRARRELRFAQGRCQRGYQGHVPRDRSGSGRSTRAHDQGGPGARRKVAVPEAPGELRRTGSSGCRSGRACHDDCLGPFDAQAHLEDHRAHAALVSAALRRDDRRLDPRRTASARFTLRHPARRAVRDVDHGGPGLSGDDRQEADGGPGAALASPDRPVDLEWSRCNFSSGRQGCRRC